MSEICCRRLSADQQIPSIDFLVSFWHTGYELKYCIITWPTWSIVMTNVHVQLPLLVLFLFSSFLSNYKEVNTCVILRWFAAFASSRILQETHWPGVGCFRSDRTYLTHTYPQQRAACHLEPRLIIDIDRLIPIATHICCFHYNVPY